MKSRSTKTRPESPLSRSVVHRMLSNPYYTGKLRYGGFEYDGIHEPIVDTDTFLVVQAVLANRRRVGDRAWKHQQYLKGSVYCGRCGERLGWARSTGRGGEYDYFFCLGRHRRRNDCDLPYLTADATEAAVTDEWARVWFSRQLQTELVAVIDNEFDIMRAGDLRLIETQQQRVRKLERRKKKLLDAYEADAVPLEDLKPRQAAITVELADAQRLIASASKQHDRLKHRVDLSLELLGRADQLYCQLGDEQRQTLNQVMFKRIELDVVDDGNPVITNAVLNPEFAALIELAARHTNNLSEVLDRELNRRAKLCQQHRKAQTPAIAGQGSNLFQLADGGVLFQDIVDGCRASLETVVVR